MRSILVEKEIKYKIRKYVSLLKKDTQLYLSRTLLNLFIENWYEDRLVKEQLAQQKPEFRIVKTSL